MYFLTLYQLQISNPVMKPAWAQSARNRFRRSGFRVKPVWAQSARNLSSCSAANGGRSTCSPELLHSAANSWSFQPLAAHQDFVFTVEIGFGFFSGFGPLFKLPIFQVQGGRVFRLRASLLPLMRPNGSLLALNPKP